jgi:hypothetical protein
MFKKKRKTNSKLKNTKTNNSPIVPITILLAIMLTLIAHAANNTQDVQCIAIAHNLPVIPATVVIMIAKVIVLPNVVTIVHQHVITPNNIKMTAIITPNNTDQLSLKNTTSNNEYNI